MLGIYADCTMTMSKTLVWIGGNTYTVRAELKADGFKWSAKKRAWWMPITEYMSRIDHMTDGQDYAIAGTASDDTPVIVAECHHGNIRMADGTVRIESYEQVCNNLGFNPDVHFVKVTNRGTITFTCGKPDEVRALRQACKDCGYKPAKSLKEA